MRFDRVKTFTDRGLYVYGNGTMVHWVRRNHVPCLDLFVFASIPASSAD